MCREVRAASKTPYYRARSVHVGRPTGNIKRRVKGQETKVDGLSTFKSRAFVVL